MKKKELEKLLNNYYKLNRETRVEYNDELLMRALEMYRTMDRFIDEDAELRVKFFEYVRNIKEEEN